MNRLETKGFTIVELMLAMSFVSMLLLAIAMTTIQISQIYTRGITLREVNQAARTVVDDMQRTVGESVYAPIVEGVNYVKATDGSGGRLCLGAYTYVWNTGAGLLNSNTTNMYKYDDGALVRFSRVEDIGAKLCGVNANSRVVGRGLATDMLSGGERELVLHAMNVSSEAAAIDERRSQGMYAISIVIGTNGGDELITSGDGACKAPLQSDNEDYCSVNKFDIIVRAGNSGQGR